MCRLFFFFNESAPPEIHPPSLPDPLPICRTGVRGRGRRICPTRTPLSGHAGRRRVPQLGQRHDPAAEVPRCRLRRRVEVRSEEHTSELQSQSNLVCRLLLEEKKTHITTTI